MPSETTPPTPQDVASPPPSHNEPIEEIPSFDSMELHAGLQQALTDIGYETPTPVQSAVFKTVSAGQDILVQSRTGTGKTAAFGIPVINQLTRADNTSKVLALAPTRELALQVARELERLCQHMDLKVAAIYGGAPMKPQIDALHAGARIVAGTPGRVLDHIRRGTLDTDSTRILILDECDEMLSMGFQEEIDAIVDTLPDSSNRQTLLFSATIPSEIQRIARRHMREPKEISLSTGGVSVDEIDHYYYVVNGARRLQNLRSVIHVEQPDAAIIFCNTRDDTNTVAKFLTRHGYDAEAISSDLSQRDRERVMKRMRAQDLHFLVATDVAARGIDIQDLSHVINYTFPESPQVYVHRTGRTGRAGKRGIAISLVGPREIGAFYYLKLTYKIRPIERDLPTDEELLIAQEGLRYKQVLDRVPEQPSEESKALARRVWQSLEGERIVGALLERLFHETPATKNKKDRAKAHGTSLHPSRTPSTTSEDLTASDRPKRRRRRRRKGSHNDADTTAVGPNERANASQETSSSARPQGQQSSANSSHDQEFWETWAEEKKRNPPQTADTSYAVATTRLYVNIGKRENATAQSIRELLCEDLETGIERLGNVLLRTTHSYVRVPEDLTETIIAAAEGKSVNERKLVVERAREKK